MLDISIHKNFPEDKRKIGRITNLFHKPKVKEIPIPINEMYYFNNLSIRTLRKCRLRET